MTSVGPERKGSVAQAAQVAHTLAMRRPAKLGLLQDRFFELGISNLALRQGWGDADCAEESDRKDKVCRVHRWSDLWAAFLSGSRLVASFFRLPVCWQLRGFSGCRRRSRGLRPR